MLAEQQPLTAHDLDRVTESVTELAQQIEVLRDVLDEIRTDVQWAVQNQRVVVLPMECIESIAVKAMAVDPLSPEWGSRLVTEVRSLPVETGVQAVTRTIEDVIDQVATAAVGLAWVRDEVREQFDAAEPEPVEPHRPAAGSGEQDATAAPARDSPGGGVESLADQQRPLPAPAPNGPAVQRSLFAFEHDAPQEPEAIVVPVDPQPSPPAEVAAPYTLDDYRAFQERLDRGDVTLDALKSEFRRLRSQGTAFIETLVRGSNAKQLQALAARCGCWNAKRNNRQENATHVFHALLRSFLPGDTLQYNPMQETQDEALAREIETLTEETWRQQRTIEAERSQAEQQALAEPTTLDDFRLCIRRRGLDSLTDEQRVRFDELSADASRAARAARQTDTVEQIQAEGLRLSIKEGWHDKKQIKLWIVQLSDRVDRATFDELNRKAKMLGGWYSSFKTADAGFQFSSEDHAQRFAALLDGDANRSDVLAARQSRKEQSAADRLAQVAETLDAEAAEILTTDETRLTNTARRADMAAGMRGRAYAQQATAGTLRSIAAALERGEAAYLNGIRAATHVETLAAQLRRAKHRRNKTLLDARGELGAWERHRAGEELSQRPLEAEDAAFAEYPSPALSHHQLAELVGRAANTRGLKQLSRRMHGFLPDDRERHVVEFRDPRDVEFLMEFLARCRGAGLETRWLDCALEDFKRLQAANIHTVHELRCALRELVPHLRRKQEDDPVRVAERQLIGRDLPGFFPTPAPVIAHMLELAGIEPGHRVLEPSAGKGDILDALREQHPQAIVTAIEFNGTLHDVLAAKGHTVERADFLEHTGQYDRIVMNPPFENGAEIAHVRHAFAQLAAHGRLVSVMSDGPFFRQDRQAAEFREWLESLAGVSEPLPEDAFNTRDAFRPTGVRTRLVTLDRSP